ncbi:MAG: hypothetical protein MUP70_03050 [Candidatus Aminicenantes bacterium]|nr:hypothetical protein [Candidatus Aminicenantes bacterium]
MDPLTVLPDREVTRSGIISEIFLSLGVRHFLDACRFVQNLPYGANSKKDDLKILFREKKGTCTTKHAAIGTLAVELGLPIHKNIGIYAMTEDIVTGSDAILRYYTLPYLPMIHCFLVFEDFRIDLTEGNHNGKNKPLDVFLCTERVVPNISSKEEYLLYRKALKDIILKRPEMRGVEMKQILQAREKGLKLLKANLKPL